MLSVFGPLAPWLLSAALAVAAGAAYLLWRRKRRIRSPGANPRALEHMKVRDFEALVRESFRQQGYKLIDAPRGAAEGGELVLRRDRETVLVQCRHWRDRKVGVEAVEALQRSMALRGAGGGFVLTSGRFGRGASAYAAGCNVRLIDGPALRGLIARADGGLPLPANTR